ncbi:MAG: hypothetical protein IJA20_02170 [Methanocorpusculum sp.]|nr:hypothetical protein [Oscillospiraceae bacterium]MBQ3569458.1 hypothetical protein [Methanocorpusculum sp.]
MKENRTIHIAVLKEHLHPESIMRALAPIARCTCTIHDDIIHITAVTELTRSKHPDNACALTNDIISELETEEKIETILDGLGCCFVLMPEEQLPLSPVGHARAEGLNSLLSSIHQVREKSNDLVHYVATQDVGFAMRRVLFYSGNALFHVLLQREKALESSRSPLTSDNYQSTLRFWAYGEYKDHTLCFVDIGHPTPEQVVRILSQYDEWYGNTDQDTEVYALEYQILTRMLLCDNKLLLNPKYLDTTEPEVTNWIDEMLLATDASRTVDGQTAFALARQLTQQDINSLCSISEM